MMDLELLGHAETAIGTIYLGRRRIDGHDDWVYEIRIRAALLMCSLNSISEQQLSTTALSLHEGAGPLKVLVGGLGLGYTAHAALQDPRVASVCVVEKMDFVVDWMDQGLLPLSAGFASEDRLEIVQGDVYELLLGPASERFDLILVDVDHAPGHRLAEGSAPFYTVEGQRLVAQHLATGGVLAVWSACDDQDFAEVLAQGYPRTCREDVHWDDVDQDDHWFHNVLFFAGGGS
jgi:spermidine synthase